MDDPYRRPFRRIDDPGSPAGEILHEHITDRKEMPLDKGRSIEEQKSEIQRLFVWREETSIPSGQ